MTPSFLALAALSLTPTANDYPNAKILIEPIGLIAADSARPILLDARDDAAYRQGHIPGAIRLPVADWSRAVPGTPAAWAKRLAELGLTAESPIVVYGSDDARESVRAWWLLKYAGTNDVRLLNGGYPAWVKAGGKPETQINTAKPIEVGKPTVQAARLAQKADVLKMLDTKGTQILDSRSEGEFCGTAAKAKRGGHIPGAIAIEWSELLDKDKKFKSPEELQKLFADKKINLDKPAVTYCQSGGRAAVLAFGLELMGAKNVSNYYKSWAEWGNSDDTPIEVEKK